jgi:uncharacterized protein involved in exopolysaccharide biosynthesis
MSEELKISKTAPVNRNDDDIHLVDVLTAFARQKKILFFIPLITGSLAIAAAFLITPVFSAKAVIFPPQQQSSAVSSMLGQLGGLAGAASSFSSLKNPNDLYVAMLQSRTIADKVTTQFDLKKKFSIQTADDARATLARIVSVENDKAGTITIKVEDESPKFAADLANAYVSELSNLSKTMAVTDASQRRLFFEKQLITAKDALADAEVELRKLQEKTGMLQLDGQVKGIITNIAQLEATIASKEVQLNAMRSYATGNNPDVMRLQGEIRGYQAQLEKSKTGETMKNGDISVPTGKIPEIGVEYVRSLRNVKYQEAMFELLSKQYEIAKIDEAKESSVIQILDNAVPAERKSKPRKMIIILFGFIGGAFLALALAMLRDTYMRSAADEDEKYRWDLLKKTWKNS